jgi:SEC-C motif-containing protein
VSHLEPGVRCPCGRGTPFDACCGPILAGSRDATTAEALMRWRYTAYAVGDGAHLLRSWATSTRPRHVVVDPEVTWTGLDVVATIAGGLLDQEGTVAFEARHRRAGVDGVLRETSRFVREGGAWRYLGPA